MAVQKVVVHTDNGIITIEPENHRSFKHPDFYFTKTNNHPGRNEAPHREAWHDYAIHWNDRKAADSEQ